MEARKTKIIQVIADSELGGGPKHVLSLLEHLDRKKFELFLICPEGWLTREARKIHGVKIFPIRFKSKFDLASMWLFRQTVEKIKGHSDPFGPLVIHVHGSRASLVARMFRISGARYVYTEHIFDTNYHLKNRINEWIQKKLLKIANAKTDAIIAVSSSVKSFLISSKLASEDRIVVIPNGIEKGRTWNADRRTVDSKSPIIGTIGSLNKLKGQRYLIEAFSAVVKKYPLAMLEMVGEGEEKKSLESLVRSLDLGRNVTFFGRVEDTSKYLKQWSVFVLPSLAETFGIAILEAFAVGVPVVASEVGGIPDIITHNIDGVLVKPRDTAGLADAILKILANHDFAKKLSSHGVNRLNDFQWSSIISTVEDIYSKLV